MKVLCILMALLFSGFCLSEESVKDQFYQAAKNGDIERIQALKDAGFDINDKSVSRLEGPALNRAVKEADIEAVEILLNMGASVHIKGVGNRISSAYCRKSWRCKNDSFVAF